VASAAFGVCWASATSSAQDAAVPLADVRAVSAKRAAFEAGAWLPPPPRASEAELREFASDESARSVSQQKANQSNLTRAQVVNLYNTLYVPGNSVAMGWTGSGTPNCVAGSTSAAYRHATLDRVNFYRQISGLPVITFFNPGDTAATEAQAAALVQGANPSLNHFPPSTSVCYSQAAYNGSSSSNLAKGGAGPTAIDMYIDDSGSNFQVGHRRWILYPPLVRSYSGDASVASVTNALKAFGNGMTSTRPAMPNGVAWPPGGFVPFQALPDISNRWSFHWPGANFSAATVTITKNGQPVSILGYDARDGDGFGDAAIVFRPNTNSANGAFVSYASPGGLDQDYQVTVTGISGGGAPASVSYTVTVIDPAAIPNVSLSGSATFSTSGNVPAGTLLCASPSAGVSCNAIDASGQFSCSVPSGWAGTLHLQAGNGHRVAAKRYTAAVTTSQSAQNFTVYGANAFACNLDIDNNGLDEASIDGVMILRNLMGIRGNESALATSGVCAQRTSLVDKAAFVGAQNFDINGSANPTAVALRDGLILLRLMLGIPGGVAVVGTGLSWASVQSTINTNCGSNF
jgi:hypothetical protein